MSGRDIRVVLDPKVVDEIRSAAAEGLLAFAEEILAKANPPDATPYGVGLVDNHGIAVFIDGRQVAGDAQVPPQADVLATGISAFVGYGFPGRFQELGTINQAARPFLTPATVSASAQVPDLLVPAFRKVAG